LSFVIAVKELLISLRLSCGTEPPEPPEELLLLLEPPLLPQAATTRAALAATAVSPTRLVTENNENHLVRGRHVSAHVSAQVPMAATAGRHLSKQTLGRRELTAALTFGPARKKSVNRLDIRRMQRRWLMAFVGPLTSVVAHSAAIR
jgi:hypothetical protein